MTAPHDTPLTLDRRHPGTSTSLRLRAFQLSDLPTITAIENSYNPELRQTVAARAQLEQSRDPALPFVQLVAEQEGQVLGFGWCGCESGVVAPDAYEIRVAVAPEHCGHGVGRSLSDMLIGWAGQSSSRRLLSACSARWSRSIAVLQAAGFRPVGQRCELTLALDMFDERRFAAVWVQLAAQGITLTTLAQERRPDALERLYRLAHPLLRGVPLPGDMALDLSFGQWCALEIDAADVAPETLVIARRGGEYIGYSNLRLPQHGPASTIMTGVRPDQRRLGVALALKLQTIRIARAHGYHELRTTNDTANPGILALNRRLGYTALPSWLVWEKSLP